jgi:16S rRNA (uracil1498-N3)-methyltransferase
MHRFHLAPAECDERQFALTGREAHHALHVLRIRAGETVTVLDGAGREFSCTVRSVSRDSALLDVTQINRVAPLPCAITLVQAIPKAKLIESIIQKATELGAARIIPLLSERVVTRLESESGAHKAEKWQQIAVEAIKQSGNAWLPLVEPPIAPKELIARKESFDLFLIGSLRPHSRHPREYIEQFVTKHQHAPKSICVWVGPEGDFTAGELDMAGAAGALPITLGRQVLRSETAATYCLSILSYEMQWHHRDAAVARG